MKVFGRAETVIQAGAGGDGDDLGWGPGCYPPGGDGGDGIHSIGNSMVTYSGVFPQGAPGGFGEPPGQDGVPTSGDVTEITPRLPTSTMQGDGKPGSTAVFSFHAMPGDLLRVVYSTEIDVFDLPNVDGHPLVPSPAGTFGVVSLSTVDSSGTTSVVFQIPPDAPLGTPFFVQGLLTSADHAAQLTNMSMLVVSMP